jgi:hypothetical protein
MSIFSVHVEKKALLVPDGVVDKFCKGWVLAWDVRFLEEGCATF